MGQDVERAVAVRCGSWLTRENVDSSDGRPNTADVRSTCHGFEGSRVPRRANPTQPEDLQWNAVGATAQCQDGTFFHGKFDQHVCADHRGVRKVLQARGQGLIR